jgi:ankyrin repeat protein
MGSNVEAKDNVGRTPLHMVCHVGHIDFVSFLVHEGRANVEARQVGGETPIMSAAVTGNLHIVEFLYEVGADVFATSTSGNNAVYHSATKEGQRSGSIDVVKCLVSKIGTEARNNEGLTALHQASFFGYIECAKYLVEEAGADILV